MREQTQARLAGLAILIAVLALPLLGAWVTQAGTARWSEAVPDAQDARGLDAYFRFPPPPEIPTDYPRFTWLAVAPIVVSLALIAGSWLRAMTRRPPPPMLARWPDAEGWRTGRPHPAAQPVPLVSLSAKESVPIVGGPDGGELDERTGERRTSGRMAWWGWCALAWTLLWWVLAWTRFEWFQAIQRYTFFPLWLGFIIVVNALTFRRAGTCMMLRVPGQWLALFAASAAFWWVFEWLNRFVRNWHYPGTEGVGAIEYAVHATISFSTVLPVVAAVSEWIAAHPGWLARCAAGPAWRWAGRPSVGAVLIAGGAAGLILTGIRPQQFYPALWVAPLALLWGESLLARRPNIGFELAVGDWRRAATWMVAALVCGFFWELWNWHSLARWIYTVPYVERWHVFEMPLLGYAGYLPFGLECLLVIERLFARY